MKKWIFNIKNEFGLFSNIKKSFSHFRKRIFNIKKIYPFYNNRSSFSYIRKKVSYIKIDFPVLQNIFLY